MSDDGPAFLVVDDNEDNRYTLTRRLRREGYTNVELAEDGREALDKFREMDFDVVLLDIMMPGMNGYEVLEHMKSDMDRRHVPVIMISALDELDSVIKCIELGAEDYLPKPFNPTLLKARIEACLERNRWRDQETAYLDRIETERQRADDLLHAILPSGAVRELKDTDEVKARRYEDVAVMFCDIVGFTEYCDGHPPEQVVAELQGLVSRYEELVIDRGLEKIKTIGDAFLATANLLQRADSPVLACVGCAIDMVEESRRLPPHWEVRIGIHQGPVVAGILGRRQFLFDLWGDTVNIAARIAEQAEPGAVMLSGSAWMSVRDLCHGESRGFSELKGKGSFELVQCHGVA